MITWGEKVLAILGKIGVAMAIESPNNNALADKLDRTNIISYI
jgi:hypothetical protein